MSQESQKNDYRALLQQALVSLGEMETKLRSVEQAQHEPIAIIGMGFRFPGSVNDADSFWQLLYNGTDAISEVPPDRWNADRFYDPDPDAVGKMYTRWGGFLNDVKGFDPHFFGISPREAISMDPQQRLLLETTWEALENAGQASAKLAGSRTGVFVGMVGSDYANLKMITGGINDVDAYFGTGISRSIAAGRIAYTFGLHGPAVAVDTACSSSLVAAHQACQSLRLRECDMAVAGGVNMILEPSGSISTSRSRMMSFDGRCKTFDATADGYVRSEGCAMIALKRLSDAIADGDNILAVIRGAAVNQDGRSNGLTAPNGKAQEAVIRAALEDAKLQPADISYVETHGTGTSLGDPIEVRALGAVFGAGRSKDNPLMIGSVKTNVGHLEAAAGIVGLVKVVLALQNKTIPPHINLNELNPYIPWDEIPVTVPTKPIAWTNPNGKPRIAGLSSFGFSGTNIHMIITEAPAADSLQAATMERASQLFTLSAKTEPALRQLAEKYETHFRQNPALSLADVTYSLSTGRSHFGYRLALTAASLAEVQEKLSAWQRRDNTSSNIHSGAMAEEGKPEVVFLFTGQGSQSAGMARQLYESQPTFRKTLDHCAELLQPHLEKPLLAVIYPASSDDENLIHQTAYTQPALFAIEYSLAKLWQSWGVEPSVVMGHSIGEYVAACIAGVFSLEDGLKLVAARGGLMQSLPGGGIMAAVFADEKRVQAAIAPHAKEVSIAALNGPGAVVISGTESSVGLVMEALQKDGIKSQRLNVSHAFHSPLMDSILEQFEQVAKSVHYHAPKIGVISNVSGKLIVDDSISNAGYWRAHVRQTVRFEDGIKALHKENYHLFLEIGPHPTLLGMARRCEPVQPNDIWLPSLRNGRGDWEQMLDSLAQLYVHGQDVDWDAFERDYKGQRRRLELPTYPFQREHYWLDFETTVNNNFEVKTDHPLLGSRLSTAMPVFQKQLSAANPAYLADHRIHDLVILPAAAYAEIALAAAKHGLTDGAYALEDISIHEALPLTEDNDRVAQIVLTPDAEGALFQYFSREKDDEQNSWRLHVNGKIRSQQNHDAPASISLDEVRLGLPQPMPVEVYYERLAAVGADYGPAFRGIAEIWRRDGEALGRIELPASAMEDAGKYSIHPALLDACFQLLGAAVPDSSGDIIYVPVGIQRMQVFGKIDSSVHCHIQLQAKDHPDSKTLTGDLVIYDDAGKALASVNKLLLQQVDQETLQRAVQVNVDNWFHEVEWLAQPRSSAAHKPDRPGNWLIFADESGIGPDLAAQLEAQGETCSLILEGNDFERNGARQWKIDPTMPDHFKQLLAEAGDPLRGVVHLWSIKEPLSDRIDLEGIHSSLERINGSVLYLVQALASLKEQTPRLWLVTQGAQAVNDETHVNPVSTTVWGLSNVLALEQPALNCARIDLDPSDTNHPELFQEIWESADEDQIAFRGQTRYLARLARGRKGSQPNSKNEPIVLQITERGVLDNLTLQPMKRKPAGPGEVEIEVYATGLNFRDVLNALGMYPGDAGPLGSECAGEVVAVGEGVSEFQIGDEVIALTNNSFGSYVTVPIERVVRKPANLSFTEAATIPIAFLTADYALNQLAGMKAGDRVLIHAAAGGVGMAAVQLAQRAGAEIFGSAGSAEKRELLKSLGVQHVMNSRTLDFHDEILSITKGEGVDIVLNSLAGDFIPKSISALKETGCFVEIGKTDVWDPEKAKQLKREISYFVLYLGEILDKDPLLIKRMLLALLADFENGALKPLPQQVFPIKKSVDAFRFMAQARHTGKIVITQNTSDIEATSPRTDATYLITGGLGGLGLSLGALAGGPGSASRSAHEVAAVHRRPHSDSSRRLRRRESLFMLPRQMFPNEIRWKMYCATSRRTCRPCGASSMQPACWTMASCSTRPGPVFER
jgi:acyl transferase domain-containing protein